MRIVDKNWRGLLKLLLLVVSLLLLNSVYGMAEVLQIAQAVSPETDSANTGTTTASTAAVTGDSDSADTVSANPVVNSSALPDLFSGEMSYSIPIEVPSGRNGMNPKIELAYRSNNGDGWVGIGWGIEVGSIQRSVKNGVNYGEDDFEFVTGSSTNKLVSIGNNEFKFLVEGQFSRIIRLVASDSWEVTDKTGRRYLYGRTTASRQDNSDQIFKWCLDYMEDTNGNYIEVSYEKDLGQIYLSQIDYTGNSTNHVAPANKIIFSRVLRPDVRESYSTHFPVTTRYRLDKIDVVTSIAGIDTLNRSYGLQYVADGSRSLLAIVKQLGSDGISALPDIKVEWQTDTSGLASPIIADDIGDWFASQERIRMMDVNGDGRQDIVLGPDASGNWFVKLSNGNGFETKSAWITGAYASWINSSNLIRAMDVNGDGMQDIVLGPNLSGNWYVLQSNGSSFVDKKEWLSSTYAIWWNNPEHIRVMDVNGDGMQDIVLGPNVLGKCVLGSRLQISNL